MAELLLSRLGYPSVGDNLATGVSMQRGVVDHQTLSRLFGVYPAFGVSARANAHGTARSMKLANAATPARCATFK